MSNEQVWWFAKGDGRFGPHTAAELKALAKAGQITAEDKVWKEGLPNWVAASSVKGLLPVASVTEPPPLVNTTALSSIPASSRQPPPRPLSGFAKTVLVIGGVVIGLIVLTGILGGDASQDSSATKGGVDKSQKAAPAEGAQVVGKVFSTGKFEIQVQSATTRNSVGNWVLAQRPADGGVYVAIIWNYRNISDRPINAFNAPDILLKSPQGTRYSPDIGASVVYAAELENDAKILSDLNPGIKVVDAAVFEVGSSHFDPATWTILVRADKDVEVRFALPEKVLVKPVADQAIKEKGSPSYASIPLHFHGNWAEPSQCGIFRKYGVPPDPGISITSRRIDRYDHYCELIKVVEAGASRVVARLRCAGEGEHSEESIAIDMTADGALKISHWPVLSQCS